MTYLGTGRTLFEGEPFGHHKGTDTLNVVYAAKGIGEVRLNTLHADPLLVTKEKYQGLKETLHPYVREYLELIFEKELSHYS